MNEGQNKRLPQASRCPDHLVEEVDLPECINMDFKELIPGARAALGTRFDTILFENVLDGRQGNAADAELSEFSENPPIPPTRFTRETDNNLPDRLQRSRSAYLLGLPATILFVDPPLIGAPMNDCDELGHTGTNSSAQLKQPLTLAPIEKDAFLGYPGTGHLVFSLEKLDMAA
jgi:hypothetical protein